MCLRPVSAGALNHRSVAAVRSPPRIEAGTSHEARAQPCRSDSTRQAGFERVTGPPADQAQCRTNRSFGGNVPSCCCMPPRGDVYRPAGGAESLPSLVAASASICPGKHSPRLQLRTLMLVSNQRAIGGWHGDGSWRVRQSSLRLTTRRCQTPGRARQVAASASSRFSLIDPFLRQRLPRSRAEQLAKVISASPFYCTSLILSTHVRSERTPVRDVQARLMYRRWPLLVM